MVCKKASVTGGSDIETNISIQYKAFIKTIAAKGWQVLFVGEKEMHTICPFCNRRVIKELEKRANEKESKNGKICRSEIQENKIINAVFNAG
jgi:hypothetical protein